MSVRRKVLEGIGSSCPPIIHGFIMRVQGLIASIRSFFICFIKLAILYWLVCLLYF